MSKLTDIKDRINQLDGGAFQNLCDAYLYCRGYRSGNSLGMKTGTDKTAKGNPDTYFLSADSKYVFVMYTTQQTDFVNKAINDIDKCFDPDKTGVAIDQVSEIILCHTYGRLTAGNHQTLNQYCAEKNALLTMIGLDELGNDLYFKYPRLARDFLGIHIGSGQIMSFNEFISNHDANTMSAPLNIPFMFREKEIQEAAEKLKKSDIVVLSGPAGTGKTRLALELCNDYAAESGYEILCIKSNMMEIYEDIVTTLEPNKAYLIFIDDANELSGLHFFLDMLVQSKDGPYGIQKIVLTVRDYARRKVIETILDYERPEIVRINTLKDEEIKKLISETMGIANHNYLDRIAEIAVGNARLAMLAAKVAADANRLDSIRDASELYDHYYAKQIETILYGNTGIRSAGMIAYFQALRLDHLDYLDAVFDLMKITKDQFIEDMKHLHDHELVDMCHDIAVKISDQSFSNYLLKYVFIDKRIIPLYQMVETCFYINQHQTIMACGTLANVFAAPTVNEYINDQLCKVWDDIQSDEQHFLPFFDAFHMIKPTETLVIIKKWIDEEEYIDLDIRTINLVKKGNSSPINDRVIKILSSYRYNSDLPSAIDLLLQYYSKRPDLFDQVYSAFISAFSINSHSHQYNYYTQKTIIERLCLTLSQSSSNNLILLFLRVAEWYLGFLFTSVESGRRRSALLYTLPLYDCESLYEYRRMILSQLLELYKRREHCSDIERILSGYCNGRSTKDDNQIIRNELDLILDFFPMMSRDKLVHCLIADHICDIAKKIKYDFGKCLTPFLRSKALGVYKMLNFDRKLFLQYDYYTACEEHKKNIYKKTSKYSLQDYQFLFLICKEYSEAPDRTDDHMMSKGISTAIDSAFANPSIYIEVIKAYVSNNTPLNAGAEHIVENLYKILSPKELKKLIISTNYEQQNHWLWCFYFKMPQEKISKFWEKDFLSFLAHPKTSLVSGGFRPIELAKQYCLVERDFFIKAISVIASQYEKSTFVFHLYIYKLLCYMSEEMANILNGNLSTFEDIYLKAVKYSNDIDILGNILMQIIEKDKAFLDQYLSSIPTDNAFYYSDHNPWLGRLSLLWEKDLCNEYMNIISEYYILNNSCNYDIAIGHLLIVKNETTDDSPQILWVFNQIMSHYSDYDRMYLLFSALSTLGSEIRRKALQFFLNMNSNFTFFERLPLEGSIWEVDFSVMRARIEYLKSLLPLVSGIKFFEHKHRIEQDIENWENRIREEEISELLESIGG